MVSLIKFCSLGKSESEKLKESGVLPSLKSSGQEEPIPKR